MGPHSPGPAASTQARIPGAASQLIGTDAVALLPAVHVMAASVQDRDRAKHSLLRIRPDHPSVQKGQRGFLVRPEQRGVERTFARIATRRRLTCDRVRSPAHAETMIRWADDRPGARLLSRGEPATRQDLNHSSAPPNSRYQTHSQAVSMADLSPTRDHRFPIGFHRSPRAPAQHSRLEGISCKHLRRPMTRVRSTCRASPAPR